MSADVLLYFGEYENKYEKKSWYRHIGIESTSQTPGSPARLKMSMAVLLRDKKGSSSAEM
jgi:hypothetical protein